MYALIRFEFRKIFAEKKCLLGLAVVTGINVLFAVAFILRQRNPRHLQHEVPAEIIKELFNAFVYTQTILAPAVYMLFPMILAVLGAYSLAGEMELGTLRMLLARPVSRWQVLGAKFLALTGFGVMLLSALLVISYLVSAIILKPWGDLIVFGFIFGLPQGIIVHPATSAWALILLSYLLALPMLMSVAAMTLMIATLTRQFTTAAILTAATYFCSHVTGSIPLLSAVHPFLPTRYMPFWKYVLLNPIPWPQLAGDALWTFGYTLVFLLIAGARFNTQDL